MVAPITLNGLATSGTTAQRPTNAQIGQPYFDTTLGVQMSWSGSDWIVSDNTLTAGMIAAALAYTPARAGQIIILHAADGSQSGPFTDFATAVAAATTNDLAIIYPGSYAVVAKVTLPLGMTLFGFNPDTTIITSSLTGIMIQGSGKTTLMNLTITSTATEAQGGNPLVFDLGTNKAINCKLHGNSDCCTTTDACTDYWIDGCTLTFDFDGADCSANATCNALITNCTLIGGGVSSSVSCVGNYGLGVFTVRDTTITLVNGSGGAANAMNGVTGNANLSGVTISTPSGAIDINASSVTVVVDGSVIYDPTKVTGALTQKLFGVAERVQATNRCTTQSDKTNATLATISSLGQVLTAGFTYRFKMVLDITADATGGWQVAASAATLTATAVMYTVQAWNAATGAIIPLTSARATALATTIGEHASGATAVKVMIEGIITVNVGGTLTTRFSQATASGTSSLLTSSYSQVERMV